MSQMRTLLAETGTAGGCKATGKPAPILFLLSPSLSHQGAVGNKTLQTSVQTIARVLVIGELDRWGLRNNPVGGA